MKLIHFGIGDLLGPLQQKGITLEVSLATQFTAATIDVAFDKIISLLSFSNCLVLIVLVGSVIHEARGRQGTEWGQIILI